MIEFSIWMTAKFLIKLTRKFGKDWLKKSFSLDTETTDLIYEGIDDPAKFGDLLHHLQNNKRGSEEFEKKLSEVKNLPEVKKESNVLVPGAKVDIYRDLLEDIFRVVMLRRHTIVIEGFLNSPEYISYFEINMGEYGIEKKEDHLDLNAFTKISLEKLTDGLGRELRIRHQRQRCKDRRFYFQYKELSEPNYEVRRIFDDYVEVNDTNIFSRSEKTEDEILYSDFNITNYDGFVKMNNSLQTYISEIEQDVRSLQNLAGTRLY